MNQPVEPTNQPIEKGRSLGASSGLVLVGRLGASAGFFVAVLVLARTLGPEGRGTLAFLTIVALVVGAVMKLGISATNTVFVPQRPAARPTLLTNTILFVTASTLVGGCVVFGSLIVFDGLGPGSVTDTAYLMCIAATVFIALSEAGLAFLIACNRAVSFSIAVALSAWLYAVLLLMVVVAGDLDVHAAIVTWVVASGLAAAVAFGAAHRGIGLGRPDLQLLVESIRFGFRAWLGGLAGFLNFRLDQVFMAYLSTEAALGIYSISVNVSEILLVVPTSVGMVLAPMVARTAVADRSQAVLRAFRLTLIVTAFSAVVGAIMGPVLIPIVFGSAFTPSVVPFLVLLPGALGFVMLRVFSSALVGSSHPGRSSAGPVAALVASVILDLALIPTFDATGAAIAASLGFLAGGLIAVGLYQRATGSAAIELVPTTEDVIEIVRAVRRSIVRSVPRRLRHRPRY